MDRRCAGALLALAACIASTAAAPTASNQTALDLYDGAQQGCYYNFQHYGEGDRIMTNEPCLNCTCHNRMLMCYLRVCPFTKPIGQDCSVEKRADQCCPIVTCPDVPVDLLTSTSTTSPAEYGETGLGKLDRYGCSINGKYFPEGAKVPPTPSKPCEHCYCIRNMTTCVMQECTLHVDGCTPIYHKDVCCPVRYSCDHPEDEIPLLDDMTTTVRPTPGFLLTTTTLSPVTQMTQDCVHDDKVFADGALIKTEKACEHCYCMKGDIVCVVQECGTPMENEGKNCTSMPPREGQCCPDTYICEGDELSTETKPDHDFTTESSFGEITTLSPPRRVIVEGSGYRKEPGEPFTEEPTFEPDTEGSGEEVPFKPIDEDKMDIPETETTQPLITTEIDDNIDQYGSSTSRIPIVDSEMIDKATTEADKGENTVPSGIVDEDRPEIPTSDKTTQEESKLATESGVTTESYVDAKTTAVHDDESSITDTITTEAEATPSKAASATETTIADYQSPTASDNKATTQFSEVTESTPAKQDEKMTSEITTLENKEVELTTKATDFVSADEVTTESAMSSVDQEAKTTAAQNLPEQENEVLVKEPTTESYLESSTKPDIIQTETEPATTITPEVTTPGKEHMIETTSVNPVDNEIDEESYPTSPPGRIPGEGDCLLDGITYSNESIVPSNNNCHTSCRCISSIVKCDPIICSAPPDYMDNCQPMYDPPESCCPTYVCDHTKETVPPQSHSQMAGTESPVPTPSVECDGDQCEISKDKEVTIEPIDSSKKPDECGTEGCQGSDKKPDHESQPSTEECLGEKCTSPQAHCADGNCVSPITPDQICDSENGCRIPETQTCQGDDCKTQPEVSPTKDSSALCEGIDGCKDGQALPPKVHCADGNCESPPTTSQICDSENGCQIPVEQACQGEDCKTQPELIPADSSALCNNADGCKEGSVPKGQVPEGGLDCEGESCTSTTGTKGKEDCKDGSNCTQPEQSPTAEECKEEGCRRKDVPDISKPITSECTDSNCISQDNLPQVTDAPETITYTVPKITDMAGTDETIPEEPVTDLPKTSDVEKEIELKITTEASIFVKDEESQLTTQFDKTDREKEEFVTDIPEIKTQAPDTQQYTTEITMQKETTVSQLEITPAPSEKSTTNVPKLSVSETDDKFTELPGAVETESPELVTKPTEQSLADDHTKIPQEDVIDDQQKHDLTTAIPTAHDVASDISEGTTSYIFPDVDTNTKVPEYVQQQDETQTESSTTVSLLDEVTAPDNIHKDSEPNVTESAESDTSASEEASNEKLDEEPMEQKPQDTVTTPKSYDGETNAPDSLETEAPSRDGLEEEIDTHTATTEKLSTLSQEQQEEKEQTELPGSRVTSDEPMTSKPVVTVSVASDDESETKSPLLPEVSPSEDDNTRISEPTATPEEELYSKTPSHDTTDEFAVTPSDISDKAKVPTESPMSIVKDKEEDETKPTQESEISVPVAEQELTTQRSDSSETSPTELYGSETEQNKPEMGEIEKDSEKELSPGDEEHDNAVTEKAVLVDESSNEQPNKETEIPEIPASDQSTDKTPVTVSIVEQPELPEPSVTEAGAVESASPNEETSEIVPVTTIPTEIIDIKAPESYTEIPTQTESPDIQITTTKDESAEKEDSVTEIPELTIHEHTESILTTEKSEQFDVIEDIATKAPAMSVTELQDISTEKEAEGVPDLQENITDGPDVFATESQKEVTDLPGHELITPGHPLTEPSEYEPKDVTTAIPEAPATELQKETTGLPEVYDVRTEVPKISPVEPEKVTTEATAPQDTTTSDSRVSVTEPTREENETPETQETATNIPDEVVTGTHKDVTGPPDSQTTIASDVSEEEPHKESTEAPDSLDIATNAPEISELDLDKEYSESPSSPDTTTKVPETSDNTVTEVQKEASEEPEPQEIATTIPETETQKSVTEIPEIATSAPKISVTEALEEASETPESQEAATKTPEPLTSGPQKDETEITDDAATHIPEISVTESQKEVTEASVALDVATDIPESPVTESQTDITPAPVPQDATTNIPESLLSETKKDTTEAPVPQDVATAISETSATESQKEPTEVPGPQDVETDIQEIPATESQKEVTETPEPQDHDASISEIPATDSPKEVTEIPATESQKEMTETPVAQDKYTNVPETLATESEKEVTEAPMDQGVVTSIPEMIATESEKEVTEAPVDQDAVTGVEETPSIETKKDTTEAPVVEDDATVIPETSAIETQKEETETPVAQDISTNIPEISAIESQKEATESPVIQDVTTNIPETSATESQKKATEAPEAEDLATNKPEIPAIETLKDVTEAPVAQEVSTNIPEISATEAQKEGTETPVVQDIATNIPVTSAPESQKDEIDVPVEQNVATSVPETSATESEKKVTEAPVSHDDATSIPETFATDSQQELTETPVAQDEAITIPEVSATESQKEVTESPVSQDVATSIPETYATDSQQDVTETSVVQDEAITIPETSATESQKEVTESPVSRDGTTSIPDTSATESQQAVTETSVAQDEAISISESSATESQQAVTETPVAQDEAISIPESSATESQQAVTETPVAQDEAISIPESSATESQKEVTETPVAQDVVENEIDPGVSGTESPKYDTTMSPEGESQNEQSTKVPESLVTESQGTVKPTTSPQESDDDKPKDDQELHTEIPTESPISSESVQPDIKSPEPLVTELQLIGEEDDTVSKSPDQSEAQDQITKTSEGPEQSSEYPETTPYLVLLEEHTHKKDIYTESPDEAISTGGSDIPTTEISVDEVTESAPITEAELPPKQESIPTEKDESAHVTEEIVSEKVTEPLLVSEEVTTMTPSYVTEEVQLTKKPQDLETNEISTASPGEEQQTSDKPSTSAQDEADKLASSATEKPHETTAPEEEFILATTKATTIKTEEDLASPSLVDKYGKPDDVPKPASEPETQKPDITDELPKPGVNEVQTTEEAPQPDSDNQFPPSGTSGYEPEPDYGEEDQAFGPGTCRYGGKVYVSAQQIPRDDPCDFCFCFRSDIICLQQSCPPPIHGCHEEPIQGFCCPRYECPVSMATTLNVTTTTTTTTTTLPPHFLPHAYKGAAQRRGCQIKGHTYKVGEVVRASSGPCLHCTCGGDGQMKCDPKVCTPEPMLRQMIAAAVASKRRR